MSILSFFAGALKAQSPKKSTTQLVKQTCIQNICFSKKPKLIFSHSDIDDNSGLRAKIYSLSLEKNNIKAFDSLLIKGYSRLPFKTTVISQIPYHLKRYMDWDDRGLYSYMEKEDCYKLIILNTTRKELIVYEFGVFKDLDEKDSRK